MIDILTEFNKALREEQLDMVDSTKFNDTLNTLIRNGYKPLRGFISKKGIEKFNDDLNEYIISDSLDETLDRKSSLSYHYKKHVKRKDEERNNKNRGKYNYMTAEEYYSYAKEVANKTPDFIIDESMVSIEDISAIIDDYSVSSNGVLKIDYNLRNKSNRKPMYVLFNKKSKYSIYEEVCFVDKTSGEPITLFPLIDQRFSEMIRDFLSK